MVVVHENKKKKQKVVFKNRTKKDNNRPVRRVFGRPYSFRRFVVCSDRLLHYGWSYLFPIVDQSKNLRVLELCFVFVSPFFANVSACSISPGSAEHHGAGVAVDVPKFFFPFPHSV